MTPDPEFDPAVHRAYLEEDLSRQRTYLESLDRDRRRAPYLAGLLLLTIPAGLLFGGIGVLLVILGTIATLVTAYYLLWGHKTEYQAKIRELEREIDALGRKQRRAHS